MQDQFSREPPVYAKPKPVQSNISHPPSSITASPGPSTPLQNTQQPITTTADPPALPPKPGSFPHNHIQPFNATTSAQSTPFNANLSQPATSNSLATRPPPSLPHHSSILEPGPPQYRTPQTSPPVPPKYQPVIAPEPLRQHPTSQSPTPAHVWPSSPPPPSSVAFSHPIASPPPPPPPPLPLAFPPGHFNAPASGAQSPSQRPPLPFTAQPTVSPATPLPPPPSSIPPPNLLDADDPPDMPSSGAPTDQESHSGLRAGAAAPPPRPPNPELLRLHAQIHEKLTGELASLTQALSLDAERLRAHQTDLLAGEPAIHDEMARLEAVRGMCQNVAGRLQATVDQAERNVTELRRKGDPEVDELVCSTTIVHNQTLWRERLFTLSLRLLL
ncbi:hypothetical protein HGRIS_013098 [Hohenbuehelia grisea]